MDVPMMEEHEWELVSPLLENVISNIKEYRETHNCGLKTAQEAVLSLACDKYNELTGFNETNGSVLWHHRLSLWGDECVDCGHLLRTPKARFCANCGCVKK